MQANIPIHTPKPQTHLPAHEQAARRERAALTKGPQHRKKAPQSKNISGVPPHHWPFGWRSQNI